MLFNIFLSLGSGGSKDHVYAFSTSTEATLAPGKDSLLQVCQQAVVQDSSRDLVCYGQVGDSSVVAGLVISFTIAGMDNCCITAELSSELLFVPHRLKQTAW